MRKPTGKAEFTAAKKTATKKKTAKKTALKKTSKKPASKPRVAKNPAPKKKAAKRSASKKEAAPTGAKVPPKARTAATPLGCCMIAYVDGRSESRNGYTQEACRELGISGGAIAATQWQKGVCA
jgi:hypothetical protein